MSIVQQKLTQFKSFLVQAGYDEKPHQVDGVEWCLKKELGEIEPVNDTKSGLIGDEMGLGKTIIMLGLIISNFVPKTLIVLPLALIEQWTIIIEKSFGHTPFVYHGANKDVESLEKAPIVITTYGMITPKNTEKSSTALHMYNWDRVIYDEAHHLRNMETAVHHGATNLKAKFRWLITGTPIQNRFSDFYALCAVMGMKSDYYTKPESLREIATNCILRRSKDRVGVVLPSLHVHNIEVAWGNDEERELALDIHSLLQFSKVTSKNVDSAISALDNDILALLIRARQLCVYPKLLEKHVKKLTELGLLESADKCNRAIMHSSKLDAVCEKIRQQGKEKNKLIFCHFRAEIDELKRRLESDFTVQSFDGRTSLVRRQEILTNPCEVLILQIQTGCEGLNLQQFNEVYFVSPHWNPAIEDQAVARCHRIGQTEEINVYKFFMESFDDEDSIGSISIDTYSGDVQETKRGIAKQFDEDNH